MARQHISLKRTLSLPVVTLFGLGTIIGAGIYVLIGEVVALSAYLTPVAFLLASIIAAFSACSYAELSARYPLSAGQAVYVHQAFGKPRLSLLIGLMMVFIGIVASATLARGFVGYFQLLINVNEAVLIVMLVVITGTIMAWGISQSAWLASITTIIEIGGLLLILWVARAHFADAPVILAKAADSYANDGWSAISAGAFIAFFAFLGFEDIVNIAEETRNPTHNVPLAVILSLLISSLLYMALSMIAIASVPIDELSGHPAPLALVYESAVGQAPHFMVFISITAIVNGTLIMMIMSSRILYGMGKQQWLPIRFSEVNNRTRTPLVSTMIVTLLVLIFALSTPLFKNNLFRYSSCSSHHSL